MLFLKVQMVSTAPGCPVHLSSKGVSVSGSKTDSVQDSSVTAGPHPQVAENGKDWGCLIEMLDSCTELGS